MQSLARVGRTVAPAAVCAVLFAALASGCRGTADADGPSLDPLGDQSVLTTSSPATTTTITTATTPDPPSTTSTSSPGSPDFPGTVPATGPTLTLSTTRIKMPASWTASTSDYLPKYDRSAIAPDDRSYFTLSDTPDFAPGLSLDEQARAALTRLPSAMRYAREADLTFAGQTWFHLAGHDAFRTADVYQQVHEGRAIRIVFNLDRSTPESRRAALIDSILATFAFR